jgi:hypothetical protein
MRNARIGALCAALLFALPAIAFDPNGKYADSPHREWFKNQHNSEGQWCCDESDGHPFYGKYVINADGSVTAFDGQQKFQIEKYKVLIGPNPTGSAVWWFIGDGAARTTFCFSPGSLS